MSIEKRGEKRGVRRARTDDSGDDRLDGGLEDVSQKTGGDYVTRAQAIEMLGIKADTLYSYVSRGLIRRLHHPNNRQSLYFREDIDKIRVRSDARRSEGVLAAGAIRYGGEPVIPTSITELTPSGQLYRGRSAIDLAKEGECFESVAELLWSGIFIDGQVVWRFSPPPANFQAIAGSLGKLGDEANIHELMSILTLGLGMSAGSLSERVKQGLNVVLDARHLIQVLSGCFGFLAEKRAYRAFRDGESIVEAMARSLGIAAKPESLRILNAALVLSADHELNPATFAARIAASCEADLYSCVSAAICAHSGTRIARACDQLEEFFSKTATGALLLKKMISSEKTSRAIPGFSHPIYPKGDPRAYALLQVIRDTIPLNKRVAHIYDFIEQAATQLQVYPRVEVAIAVMAVALDLPPRSAAGIYTFGRTAGWVAHVMEQRLTGYLIRPRAKFIGMGR
jgi:citrate synthase